MSLLLLIFIQPPHCNSISNESHKEPIYILTLLPYYNPHLSLHPSLHIGDDVQPAMELARTQINKNLTMLENYTIHLIHGEGGCKFFTTTITSFVEEVFGPNSRHKLTGIIGPSCSSSTIALSSLMNRSELGIVMVHGSGSPTLSDRQTYNVSYIGFYFLFIGFFINWLYIGIPLPISYVNLTIIYTYWCLPIGHTLLLGPAAMRTFRLYRVFKPFHRTGRFLKDPYLLVGVGIMLFMDVILGTLQTVFEHSNDYLIPFVLFDLIFFSKAILLIIPLISLPVTFLLNLSKFLWL